MRHDGKKRTSPRWGLISAVVLLVSILMPLAHAAVLEGPALDEEAEQYHRFFENMPAEVRDAFGIPLEKTGKLGEASTESSHFGPRPRPVPEKAYPIITGADLDELPVIDFMVVDEFGIGIEGFAQGENVRLGFLISKLVPGANGVTPNWSSYFRSADEGVPDAQATTYGDGMLEDLGDGNYRFTFDLALESISGVTYEPALTHRVGLEVRDPELRGEEIEGSDTTFEIQPSTGNTEGIAQRNIITQEACASCHGVEEFAFHGGPRQDVANCVNCHQPGSFDPGSGNTINFTTMIHKIHFGENLSNQPYEFCGFGCENFGAPPTDFSHVVFPQDIKNCEVCHDPANPETPQAEWVDSRATAEACASCHDDLAFDENGLTNANRNHIGLAQPNETCEACHSPSGLLQGNLAYHENPAQVLAQQFSYNIHDVMFSGEGESPVVTFSVTDPTNDDAPYDLANDPQFTGDGASFRLTLAWPNTDFSNVANDAGTTTTGRPAGQAAGISLLPVSPGVLPGYITDNDDGTYTVDTMMLSDPLVVPSTNPPLGSGTAMLEGHPAADLNHDGVFDEDNPVTSATMEFAITDQEATPRRTIVSVAKCQDCHGVNDGLAFHGGNRSDNVEACSTCHNPNATDLFRRPVDPDGMVNGVNEAAADGLEDQSISFAYMVHSIHAASVKSEGYVAYGFGGSVHDYSDAGFPRSVAECQACHEGDSYTLPLGSERLATTKQSNATVVGSSFFGANAFAPGDGSATDPTDDNNLSPEGAACVSCHDSETAIAHMSVRSDSPIAFGNAWVNNPDPFNDPDTQSFINMSPPENCSFCHGEDGFVSVSEVHGLDD